jgi:hypothetical protein
VSEFRIFCIVAFVSMALVVAASDHGLVAKPTDGAAGLVGLGFMLGCAAIALFGKRSKA